MKIKTITYQRVKNLGNYESERMEVTAELNDDDDPELVGEDLKTFVSQQLNIKDESDGIAF